MILFTILFSLIGLAITLALLPLKLAKIPIKLALLPVRMFIKNPVMMLILLAVAFLYLSVKNSDPALPTIKPVSMPSGGGGGARVNGKTGPILIEKVKKHQDGDSSFAADLYAEMTEDERLQYSRNFYWAMTNLPDNQAHVWNSMNIAGTILPTETFANKANIRCRKFTEVLKVHTIQQTISGTACSQAEGAWCKLKKNATPACGLGRPTPGILENLSDSIGNLF